MEDRYVILSALHKVAGSLPIARYFWLLGKLPQHNSSEEGVEIIEAIHGLASIQRLDNNNHRYNYKLQRTGGASSRIYAFCVPAPDVNYATANSSSLTLMDSAYWIEPDKRHIVYGDSPLEVDAKARWDCAKRHLKTVNEQRVPYSKLGVGNLEFLNGNTVYCVVAGLMGITPYVFPIYLNPGMSKSSVDRLLPEVNIDRLLSSSKLKVSNAFLSQAQYTIQVGVTALPNILTNQSPNQKKRVKGSHYFFMLNKEWKGNKDILEAIHGLPAGKSPWGGYLPNGSSQNAVLMAYCLDNPLSNNRASVQGKVNFDGAWISPEKVYTVYGARPGENDAQEKWSRAKDYITLFNVHKLRYSMRKIGFPFVNHCINGNSLYCAMSEVMGITPAYQFGQYSKAGFNTISLLPDDIESVAALAAKRAQRKRDTISHKISFLPPTSSSPSSSSTQSTAPVNMQSGRREVTWFEEDNVQLHVEGSVGARFTFGFEPSPVEQNDMYRPQQASGFF